MPISKHVRSVAAEKLRFFFKHCTLHGFHYFSEKQHWLVYTTWIIIITASSILCGCLCHMIWQKLVVDPTFTVVESTHYSTMQVPFPAVTMCDPEGVYGPNTENVTYIFHERGYDDEQIKAFYGSVTRSGSLSKDYVVPPYLKKMYKILADLDYSIPDIMTMLAKPCNTLLVECTWRGNSHNCSEMFYRKLTMFGICCQFDMEYFQRNANEDTNFVPGIETEDALAVVLNGDKIPFQGERTTDGYTWLFIYDDKTRLTVMDYPIILTSQAVFDISINLWIIDSSKEVEALALKTRKCLLSSELLDDDTYQPYQECVSRLVLKDVVRQCRCLPYGYTARKLHFEEIDYPKCTWDKYVCVHRKMREVQSNLKDIIAANECWQRCDYVQYATEIDYVKKHNRNGAANGNYSLVSVHFATSTCLKYRRELLYVWDQMLANLGGIFGLCLGGSMISVIEIVWFAIDLVISVTKAACASKTKLKKNKVFIISEKKHTKNLNHLGGPLKEDKHRRLKFIN